ncbi:MAG TPA: ABC transporter substrate-binding protein [Rhizomicrobium sp.]|jgi:phospholipid transport system substrate-binding protein|nr:ABC transporter substrate-binding protein [Rhizomicrobium sp.]
MTFLRALPVRFAQAVLFALAITIAGTGLAQAATPAEDFIQTNVQRGLGILNDHALAPDQKRDQFRTFLESLTDLRRVALFTLGPAGRTASQGDKDAFVQAFHDYAVSVYNSRLSHYDGQVLKVTGSQQRAAGDFVVNTVLLDPPGQMSRGGPTRIDFRVLDDGGRLVLMDVSVEGIWLSLEERDQFVSFLADHNNDVRALAQHLEDLTTAQKSR